MSTEGTTGMLNLHFVHATYARCECATVGGIQHGRRTVPDGTAATGPDGPMCHATPKRVLRGFGNDSKQSKERKT